MGSVGKTRAALIVNSVIDAMEALGIDMAPILAESGLRRSPQSGQQGWVPVSQYNVLWCRAFEASRRDPLLGSKVAQQLSGRFNHGIRVVVEQSATLGDAMIRLSRLGRVLGAGFNLSLEVHGAYALIRDPESDALGLHYQATLCQLSTLGLMARSMAGEHFRAERLHLVTSRPATAHKLEEHYGCEIRFDALHNAVELRSEILCLPIKGSDARRLQASEEEIVGLLATVPNSTFTDAVRDLLRSGIGAESVVDLATHLGLAARSVARKLAAEGHTYQSVRDELRAEQAKVLLRTTDLPTIDIALGVGFSDGTAFSRAFKRWAGLTPSAYREQARFKTVAREL